MYIVLEGMPGTGKTALARQISETLGYKYIKSVISDTPFGTAIKKAKDNCNASELEYLFLADALSEEIRVSSIIRDGEGVVRDKCLAASMGHIKAHGFINTNKIIQDTILAGYNQVKDFAEKPDLVVHMVIDEEAIRKHLLQKKDLSEIDKTLLNDMHIYRKQDEMVRETLDFLYGDHVMDLKCFTSDLKSMCNMIIDRIGAEKNDR